MASDSGKWLALVGTAGTVLAVVVAWQRHIRKVERRKWARAALTCEGPIVLTGVPLGACLSCWSDKYLEKALGDNKMSVHVSETRFLDFARKNFAYEILTFQKFIQRVQSHSDSSFLYYRSQNSKRNKPSSLEAVGDVANDFKLPSELLEGFSVHSTVLRIASQGLCMWLHYDVCDNFLCCVRGRKRVVLFHPEEIGQLYVSSSSSALGSRLLARRGLGQLWDEFPLARAAFGRRLETVLEAGDVLFIPAFWPHCTETLPSGADQASISVNTFLVRPEKAALHDPKDVWANRELLPAQEAGKSVEKALQQLSSLPPVPKAFYCRKLAAEFLALADAG
mmetsp:Transcript_24557/g.46364  ORF Transcript_24557/g.46364 Transcript_24557/m.46364 type:complete len:337 (-) Transcript_24557:27-1037(-)